LTYAEQLEQKRNDLKGILNSFKTSLEAEIKRGVEVAPTWFREQPEIPLADEVLHTDTLEGYRHKVEFTVGRVFKPLEEGQNPDEIKDIVQACKGDICVGFNMGALSKGIVFVDKPDTIRVNSPEALQVAKIFEQIVVKGGQEPYDRCINKGFWRILLYRESKVTKQILVSVVITKP